MAIFHTDEQIAISSPRIAETLLRTMDSEIFTSLNKKYDETLITSSDTTPRKFRRDGTINSRGLRGDTAKRTWVKKIQEFNRRETDDTAAET